MSDTMLQTFQRIFRVNMLIGLSVTVVAIYMIITGSYEGLEARRSTEAILSWTAIAGVIYTVGFWFACMFRKQFFQRSPVDS
ncbi:MAG: hypothetical protein OQK98_16185 [Gammaproteobacteria bacterium]|nr:hypothetical protein [Gammaproteobacteria bacterium]